MPNILLTFSNPRDESTDNVNTGGAPSVAPAGGILGSGDLTSNDGDTSGYEAWNSNTSVNSDPGTDTFRYDVDAPVGLPADAVLTGYRVEFTVRVVESAPQGYPNPTITIDWGTGSQGHEVTWGAGEDFFNYTTKTSITFSGSEFEQAMKDALLAGTADVLLGAMPRDPVNQNLGAIRVTMAGIRVYYTTATPTMRRTPHLRGFQRGSDGQGITGGKRGLGNRSRQASIRRGPGSFY